MKDPIFRKENILLFEPYDGVETISSILENIGFEKFGSNEAKNAGLDTIKSLLKHDLIEVVHWGKYHDILKKLRLTNEQALLHIENVWFEGADFADFASMPIFKYKDWYIRSLENQGLTKTTDWKTFFTNKIVDIESWINKNSPMK